MNQGKNCSYCCGELDYTSFIKTIENCHKQTYCSFSCFEQAENRVCETCSKKIPFNEKKILIRDIYRRIHCYCSSNCIRKNDEKLNFLFSDLNGPSKG